MMNDATEGTSSERILPCGSEEMQTILWHLKQADNQLITAQDKALDDSELTERILEIRRPLTELIQNIEH